MMIHVLLCLCYEFTVILYSMQWTPSSPALLGRIQLVTTPQQSEQTPNKDTIDLVRHSLDLPTQILRQVFHLRKPHLNRIAPEEHRAMLRIP